MESLPSTEHLDKTGKALSKNQSTNSCDIHKSDASSYDHQTPVFSKRTSFLGLPGELRNQIYGPALRHDKIKNLKLEYKVTSDGSIYINERFPPLYHALPQLREEILPIYYSENQFRVHLRTEEHRGKALDGLKQLDIVFRKRRPHLEPGYYYSPAALLLTFGADGQLSISRIMPTCASCYCWVIPLVEAAHKRSISQNNPPHLKRIHNESGTINNDNSTLNPILAFALKMCSLRDLPQENQPKWPSLLHQLNEGKHKGLRPCWRNWESLWTALGLLENSDTMRPRCP